MYVKALSLKIVLASAVSIFPATTFADNTVLSGRAFFQSLGTLNFGLEHERTTNTVRLELPRTSTKNLKTPRFSTKNQARTASYVRPRTESQAVRLRHLIGYAEASREGYDSIQHGARIRPGKKPTTMTLREIFSWIRATPGQPHAIGRYQFIPSTLKHLVGRAGLHPDSVFSPQLQDALADFLLDDAGYSAHVAGQMSRNRFMHNLAGIWAGLPMSNGLSRYHGYAGNRATISWKFFASEIASIFGG